MEAINERKVESKIIDIGHYAFHLYIVPLFLLPKSSKMHVFGVIILLFVHAYSFFSKKKEWGKLCIEILQCQGCKCKFERRKQRGIVAQDHN